MVDRLNFTDQQSIEILERMSDGFFALDLAWRFRYINSHAQRLFDVRSKQVIGLNIWESQPQLIGTSLETSLRDAMDGQKQVSVESYWESTQCWYQIRIFYSELGLTVYCTDTTQQHFENAIQPINEGSSPDWLTPQLLNILDILPIGVYISDPNGALIVSNAAGRAIWAEDIVDANSIDSYVKYVGWRVDTGELLTPDTWAMARTLRNGEIILNEELKIIALDGKTKFILNSAVPLKDAQGNLLGGVVVIVDLTERKRAEDALRASEETFRVAAEMVPAPLFITRLDSTCEYLNKEFYRFTGLPEDSGLDEGWVSAVHPDDREALNEAWIKANVNNEPFESQYRLRRADGAYLWFLGRSQRVRDADGNTLKWAGVSIDIDDMKRLETERDQLLETEQNDRMLVEQRANRLQHMQAVIAALSQALTIKQVAQVIVERGIPSVGAAAGAIFLLTDDDQALEIVASMNYPKPLLDHWRKFSINTPTLAVTDCVRTQKAIWLSSDEEMLSRYPAHLPRSDLYHAWATIPLIVDGRAIGVLGLMFYSAHSFETEEQDFIISMANYGAQALKRSQLYEETQQARLTAESAVQTRDEFLAIASHELKNPLTGLIGHVQLLERRLLRMQMLTDRDGQSLKTINTQAKRIQSMIEQLLDLAHLDKHVEFDSELINLPILINTVIAEVEPSLQRHTISFNEKVSEVILRGDPIRLAQVLHNLLGNAIKYSPEGGNVSVELDRQGDHVKISITDQGIGIAAESIPKLFSRFYRVPNSNVVSVNGFGIGLYVVKEIVQRHGGEVLVESQLGVGSTFTITLPISGMM